MEHIHSPLSVDFVFRCEVHYKIGGTRQKKWTPSKFMKKILWPLGKGNNHGSLSFSNLDLTLLITQQICPFTWVDAVEASMNLGFCMLENEYFGILVVKSTLT